MNKNSNNQKRNDKEKEKEINNFDNKTYFIEYNKETNEEYQTLREKQKIENQNIPKTEKKKESRNQRIPKEYKEKCHVIDGLYDLREDVNQISNDLKVFMNPNIKAIKN